MTKQKLKLVKSGKKRVIPSPEAVKEQLSISNLRSPTLTPAEQVEAERFKALTKERAARQALVRRIIRKLQEWDVPSRVA